MGTVLITGTNQGIGLALTQEYLRRGEQVIATCRQPDHAPALQALVSGNSLSVESLEVTNADSLAALGERLKDRRIDTLIANAGVFDRDLRIGALDYGEYRNVLETNVIGVLATIEACMPALRRAKAPKIIGISSALGSIQMSTGGRYFYRSSKAALNMLIRSLAVDYKESGFIFAVLSPGLVDTGLTRDINKPKISATQSAAGMAQVITSLSIEQTGTFLRYSCGELPW